MSDSRRFGSPNGYDGNGGVYHDENLQDNDDLAAFHGGATENGPEANRKAADGADFEIPVSMNFPQYPDHNPFGGKPSGAFTASQQHFETPRYSSGPYPQNMAYSHRPPGHNGESSGLGPHSGSGGFQVDGNNIAEPIPSSPDPYSLPDSGTSLGPSDTAYLSDGYDTADSREHSSLPYMHQAHKEAKNASLKKTYGAGALVTGMAVAALVGAVAAMGASAFVAGGDGGKIGATVEAKRIINNQDNVNGITAVVDKAAPSIVTIGVSSGNGSGSGSGVVIDDKGHILTNTHVVTLDGQTKNPVLEVRLRDGQVYPAKIIGLDPMSDLAVMKINAQGLTSTSFGDSDKLNVGENVVAIGSPLGLDDTATDGIISNLNRTIQVSSSAVPENSEMEGGTNEEERGWNFAPPRGLEPGNGSRSRGSIALNVLQTDASINPGNSGGALLNGAGELIGVNVAIASAGSTSLGPSGSIGVGFSIPSNYAKRIVNELIEKGKASHGQLGVTVKEKKTNLESTFSAGAEIARFAEKSPAQRAGLEQGDVILAAGKHSVSSPAELNAAIRERPAGSEVEVKYLRGKEEKTIRITLDGME